MQNQIRKQAHAAPDLKVVKSPNGRVRFEIQDPAVRYHFWETFHSIRKSSLTPTHTALLMRSILTMATSASEVLVSNIYRTHLMCNPGAAENSEEKAFSLHDLSDFGSIQDAIDESVFQQSDAFSRKGIRAWATWFKGRPLGIDLSVLALDWIRTVEVFERRNVVVHNASRVTRQYLTNVDSSLTAKLSEGDRIEITPEYVDDALSRLSTLGILLALQVRLKLFKKDNAEETSTWISKQTFHLICDERFEIVAQIAKCTSDLKLAHSDLLLLRVNGWISQMRLEGVDSCLANIQQWDTSALSGNFRTAKQVLLRDDENALGSIQSLLDEKSLSLSDLAEWPLFYWMREAGVLADLLKMGENLEQQSIGFESVTTSPESRDEGTTSTQSTTSVSPEL
jgi:hypothetical protein